MHPGDAVAFDFNRIQYCYEIFHCNRYFFQILYNPVLSCRAVAFVSNAFSMCSNLFKIKTQMFVECNFEISNASNEYRIQSHPSKRCLAASSIPVHICTRYNISLREPYTHAYPCVMAYYIMLSKSRAYM